MINEIPPPSRSNLEQVQAITILRSRRIVDNKVDEKTETLAPKSSSFSSKNLKVSPEILNPPIPNVETSYEPKAPFPQHLKESTHFGKKGNKIQEIFEIFKQVRLTEQASAIIQHNTPPKFKDLGAPTISCVIGDNEIEKALIDLGFSVNLIPYSVYLQLGLGELKLTMVVLQLADKSVKQPRGIIEDVIIKVDKFYFLVDFLVLDTEPVHNPKRHIPVQLNIFNVFQHPPDEDGCFLLDIIDEVVEESLPFNQDPLKTCLAHFDSKDYNIDQSICEINSLLKVNAISVFSSWKLSKEPLLLISSTPHVLLLNYPPQLELKPLPANLKYVFLGTNKTLPVIIASDLSKD
ncbi:uncharacterized protein LOC132313797 [Cornus florida]|uniref:uncharacterized protein LOC132313797 n=1 Tax=Cornus florida TaxID=4283 RepID=UPI0028983616|nr:uncharacterized protein LOC132313797 [Cornus florida]